MKSNDLHLAPSTAPLTARYRPQLFAEVAGQEAIRAILSRAAAEGKVAPAYLFSGTRGVGKTTLARIFAKALNCVNGPGLEPCNTCESCRQITQGIAVDVAEIDGASNRGIDDAKRLKEDIGYAPLEGRYKIFIIDEAHMLTREAFNALLKTLEEPPGRVTFILATTEPHKFPATIISRCQHFTFKRLSQLELKDHLSKVLTSEGIVFEEEAVNLLARRAAGSVRDGMSLLGQVLALGSVSLSEDDTRNVLGLAGQELFLQLVQATVKQNCVQVAQVVQSLLEKGVDMGFFLRELGALWRNLFMLRQAGKSAYKILDITQAEGDLWQEVTKDLATAHIHACWQLTLEGQRRVLDSLEPGQALELLLLNIAILPSLIPVGSLPDLPVSPASPASPVSPQEISSAGSSAGSSTANLVGASTAGASARGTAGASPNFPPEFLSGQLAEKAQAETALNTSLQNASEKESGVEKKKGLSEQGCHPQTSQATTFNAQSDFSPPSSPLLRKAESSFTQRNTDSDLSQVAPANAEKLPASKPKISKQGPAEQNPAEQDPAEQGPAEQGLAAQQALKQKSSSKPASEQKTSKQISSDSAPDFFDQDVDWQEGYHGELAGSELDDHQLALVAEEELFEELPFLEQIIPQKKENQAGRKAQRDNLETNFLEGRQADAQIDFQPAQGSLANAQLREQGDSEEQSEFPKGLEGLFTDDKALKTWAEFVQFCIADREAQQAKTQATSSSGGDAESSVSASQNAEGFIDFDPDQEAQEAQEAQEDQEDQEDVEETDELVLNVQFEAGINPLLLHKAKGAFKGNSLHIICPSDISYEHLLLPVQTEAMKLLGEKFLGRPVNLTIFPPLKRAKTRGDLRQEAQQHVGVKLLKEKLGAYLLDCFPEEEF